MKSVGLASLSIMVEGIVQGVGFRPFVARLATELGLGGTVRNTTHGVAVEIEGEPASLDAFVARLLCEAPPSASVQHITTAPAMPQGRPIFAIDASDHAGSARLAVAPDLAPCKACLCELADPQSRRYGYPFLSCTACGPRYSVITGVPYDRRQTTMDSFRLCPQCQAEYADPWDRRYHAESTACPTCGPQIALWNGDGQMVASQEDPLFRAAALLRAGQILAVKGLGGFQLWADARSDETVRRLRQRKRRPAKPFAVLFPTLEAIASACELSPYAATQLTSPAAPIVLLRGRARTGLSIAIAPGNALVGAMLPSTPLHVRLMTLLDTPVVVTSGNRAEEPIAIDEHEALTRLHGIADAYLIHDRPIARPVDDSVVKIIDGRPTLLRRARGYVPRPIPLPATVAAGTVPILALGGHLKSTVALTTGRDIVLSQHLGDLDNVDAFHAFRRAIDDLMRLLGVQPRLIVCDRHPDYRSTAFARELAASGGLPLVQVQHHHAHVAACMAEHGLGGEVLGVAWDGAGYGADGTIWGGEFLLGGYQGVRRIAHLKPFRLLGGEAAMLDPQRSAAALLWDLRDASDAALRLEQPQLRRFQPLLAKGLASPWTTSAGRLFDGMASLLGLAETTSFEGQAAMAVEFAAERCAEACGAIAPYPCAIQTTDGSSTPWIADWQPLIRGVLGDVAQHIAVERIAYRFHATLAELIGQVAERVDVPRVVLTGGCFQNGLLTRLARRRLEQAGFTVYTHSAVPPNDGGLAVGQAVIAARHAARATARSAGA